MEDKGIGNALSTKKLRLLTLFYLQDALICLKLHITKYLTGFEPAAYIPMRTLSIKYSKINLQAVQLKPLATANLATLLSLKVLKCFLALLFCCSVFVPRGSMAQSDTYAQAESLVRNHQWNEGLAALTTLLKREPHNLKALNLAGLAMIGRGDTQQANDYFRRAIVLDPEFVPAIKNLSINEFNAKQYPEAEKHLLAAQKITPNDPAIAMYLGEIYYRRQQYRSAAEEFSRAHEFVLRSPAASAHLAASYLLTNDQQKALAILDTLSLDKIEPKMQFELALALDQAGLPQRALTCLEAVRAQFPDSYEVAFDLTVIDLEAKRFVPAIETAEDLIAQGHETAELDNVLAQAHEGNLEPQLALDAYRRAIALDPKDEENYIDLASLCMNQRALESGMTVIAAGLQEHPKSERLIFLRGLIHASAGDLELAESDFKFSEQLSPANSLGYIGLGDSYMETGHSAEALAILRQRLRDKPDDASLLYLLGETLIRSGAAPKSAAYVEAQTAFERSTALNPSLCLPHISLGTIYLDEGRNQDAALQFEKARSIDPTERSTYSHLAVAYKRLGEPDKSKEVLAVLKGMLNHDHQDAIDKMKTAKTGAPD